MGIRFRYRGFVPYFPLRGIPRKIDETGSLTLFCDSIAACEKSVACSTCHVILEEDVYDKLEEPDDDENVGRRTNQISLWLMKLKKSGDSSFTGHA